MSEKIAKVGIASQITRRGLSIVSKNSGRSGQSSSSAKDGINESLAGYAGYEPDLVPICHELYYLKPTKRTVNERRHPRIPCRNVKACIKTEQGSSVVVDVVNISRGGLCFTSVMEFHPGTQVSIATHYIEGGHNIFQDGRIVRVHSKGSTTVPGEYGVEFLY
jgi:PilZ domain